MRSKTVFFTVLALAIAAFGVVANGQQPPPKPDHERGPSTLMQMALNATEEQLTLVHALLDENHRKMDELQRSSSINHHDMELLHGISGKFSMLATKSLISVFNEKQLEIAQKEVFHKYPFAYLVLSDEEKLALFKDAFPLDRDQTEIIAQFIRQESIKQKTVLENLGINQEELLTLHKAMLAQHAELQKSLGKILDEKQLALFTKIQGEMEPGRAGHHPAPPHHRGERP